MAEQHWGFDREVLRPFLADAEIAIEFGIGTGLNLPAYDPETEILGADLSASMLDQAQVKARRMGQKLLSRAGKVRDLGWDYTDFDVGLATWFFSVTPTPETDLHTLLTLVKKGGKVVIVDHFAESRRGLRQLMGNLNHRVNNRNPYRNLKPWLLTAPVRTEIEIERTLMQTGQSFDRSPQLFVIRII